MSSGPSNPRGLEILETVKAKALADPSYRERLIASPTDVLREEGIQIDDDVQVVIHENTSDTVNLVLPHSLRHPAELEGLELDIRMIGFHTGGV